MAGSVGREADTGAMRTPNRCAGRESSAGEWQSSSIDMGHADPVMTEWLTVNEAARYLKVKPRSLLLWARQGKIKGFALSGTKRRVWRFLREDLDDALLAHPVLPSAAPTMLTDRRQE